MFAYTLMECKVWRKRENSASPGTQMMRWKGRQVHESLIKKIASCDGPARQAMENHEVEGEERQDPINDRDRLPRKKLRGVSNMVRVDCR